MALLIGVALYGWIAGLFSRAALDTAPRGMPAWVALLLGWLWPPIALYLLWAMAFHGYRPWRRPVPR